MPNDSETVNFIPEIDEFVIPSPKLSILNWLANKCRRSAYGRRGHDGGVYVARDLLSRDADGKPMWGPDLPLTEAALQRHLTGADEACVSVYPIQPGSDQSYVVVFDVDDHGGVLTREQVDAHARRIIDAAAAYGLTLFAVRSGGGHGIHLWGLWDTAHLASWIRSMATEILLTLDYAPNKDGNFINGDGAIIEVFPKQDSVPADGYGNHIALPFGRRSVPLSAALTSMAEPGMWVTSHVPPVKPIPVEAREAGKALRDLTMVDLRQMLQCIRPDSCNERQRVARALRHPDRPRGISVGEARDAWLAWLGGAGKGSQGGPVGGPGMVKAKKYWDRLKIKKDAPATFGTVVYLAKIGGWIAPEPEKRPKDDVAGSTTKNVAAANVVLAEFNADHMVVMSGGKTLIYRSVYDPILERTGYWQMSFGSFRNAYLNKMVMVQKPDGVKYENAAEFWLTSFDRRQYLGGVIFDPSEKHNRSDVLNLWDGFSVTARKGSWERLRGHIRGVICSASAELYSYMMGWMATLIQFPGNQGEVAVVMRGDEGCGKGILARALAFLFGKHGLVIQNAEHLVGKFNAHLRDCAFLFADEAFFAGDKKHTGVLKAMVTEAVFMVEGKYANAEQAANCISLMMASNRDWVVPADLKARRWFMLDVPNTRRGDHAYFGAIVEELENGGYEAMLHDLMHYDLTDFNVRKVPHTAALSEQKKHSLESEYRWWLGVLSRGYVFQSQCGLAATFTQWMPTVTTELLHRSYLDEVGRDWPIQREQLGRFMAKVGYKPDRAREPRIIGEERTDVANDRGYTRLVGRTVIKTRSPGYFLGTLDEARAQFLDHTGLTIDWADEEIPLVGGKAAGLTG